jgi:hypothetical protein
MIRNLSILMRPADPTADSKLDRREPAESVALELCQNEPNELSSDSILDWDFEEFGEGWI